MIKWVAMIGRTLNIVLVVALTTASAGDFTAGLEGGFVAGQLAAGSTARWQGSFSDSEKAAVTEYFNRDRLYEFQANSVVVRGDVDGDGRPDYVVTAAVEDPQPFLHGEVLCLLLGTNAGLSLRVIDGPAEDTGLPAARRIELVDIDGNRMQDIVDQQNLAIGGDEEANLHATIYKNDGLGLRIIYTRDINDYLAFRDLDKNKTIEILETLNEHRVLVGPQAHWVNVYNWNTFRLQLNNDAYPDFYAMKAAEYRKLLESGDLNGVSKSSVSAIREAIADYLKRIDTIRSRRR